MCTSDIIETIFGQYKKELNQNPMNGITDIALIIPAMTSNLDKNEIMKAIQRNKSKNGKKITYVILYRSNETNFIM
jgi:hypothetical protein